MSAEWDDECMRQVLLSLAHAREYLAQPSINPMLVASLYALEMGWDGQPPLSVTGAMLMMGRHSHNPVTIDDLLAGFDRAIAAVKSGELPPPLRAPTVQP